MSSPIPSSLWRDPQCVIALGFGAGALPKAPGTWGTLAAIPFYLVLQPLTLAAYVAVVTVLFATGIVWCGKAARSLGVDDHPAIVWDEMVGFWVTMTFAPRGWFWIVCGFMFFRLFDIWKPWPIQRLDRQVAGGLGIMADDVMAGLYSACCLYIAERVFAAG